MKTKTLTFATSLILSFAFLFLSLPAGAQLPQGFKYQAALRDNGGVVMSNQTVDIKITISNSIESLYIEEHSCSTNDYGLVNINIGMGSILFGIFNDIVWVDDEYFLQVEVDTGEGYVNMGKTQLLSVPFALHSGSASRLTGPVIEIDPVFSMSPSFDIKEEHISEWEEAYKWGDHAKMGYMTSFIESDPTWEGSAEHVSSIGRTGSVGIGIATPAIDAILELNSANKAFLISRVSDTRAIANPVDGMIIYVNDKHCLKVFRKGAWSDCLHSPASYPEATIHCNCFPTEVVEVLNPETDKIWMDRNLGAQRKSLSSGDDFAYGDLYQWGRASDGHQCRTSSVSANLGDSDQPLHGKFITSTTSPSDWRLPQNNDLWQGVNGINNPCPEGFRVPTESEWNSERQSWISNNAEGAFNSPLKLPMAGHRSFSNAMLNNIGSGGSYWSSTIDGTNAQRLSFSNNGAFMNSIRRADGHSVRCIKNSN
jgi:uncharacterized protein (TIGR02145 family)